MSRIRPLLLSVAFAVPLLTAGCGGVVAQGIRDGDTACSRPSGSEGGCQRVPSSDRYEQERQEVRDNRKGGTPE